MLPKRKRAFRQLRLRRQAVIFDTACTYITVPPDTPGLFNVAELEDIILGLVGTTLITHRASHPMWGTVRICPSAPFVLMGMDLLLEDG